MSTEKHVHLQSPYTSNMLNRTRSLLHGARIGSILSGMQILPAPPVKKEEGRGDLSVHGTDSKIRVINDSSATFMSNGVAVGDWLVIGGDILLTYANDRPKHLKGNVNAGLPNFYDAVDTPFRPSDVNKLLMVYSAVEYNIHKILSYNSSGNVVTDHTFPSNRSNLLYSLLEPVGNWGIYEVAEVVSEQTLEVNAVKEFVNIGNEPYLGLSYACYTPAKLILSPGSFINNGIITEVISSEEVYYPATYMLPNTPPMFLVAQTPDEREGSPVLLEIVMGLHASPNAVVLAASVSKYYEHQSKWFHAAPQSPGAMRAEIDKLVSGHGQPGWHTKPFQVEFDDVVWPPKLRVFYPQPDDGGIGKHTSVSTRSQVSGVDAQHGEQILDVDIRPPVASPSSRIDHLVVVSRKNRETDLDLIEDVPIPDDIGNNYLSYNTGVANPYNYTKREGLFPTPKGATVFPLNGYHGTGNACAPKVIANSYGTVVMAHAQYDGGNYHMVFHKVTPEMNDFDFSSRAARVDVACSSRPNYTMGVVDVNGCFHFIWQEAFSDVYYIKIDPYANNIMQPLTVVPDTAGVASNSLDMCVSLTGEVTFIWKDGSDIMGVRFKPDGQGNLDTLVSATVLYSAVDFYDAGVEESWDSERVFLATLDTSGICEAHVFDKELNLVVSYTIPSKTVNVPDGIVNLDIDPYTLKLLRNNMDEIVLFIHGEELAYGYSLLATKLSPLGMSNHGFVVCDPFTIDSGDLFVGVDFSPLDDGGWICFGNDDPGSLGQDCILRLSSSLEALSRSIHLIDSSSIGTYFKRTSSIAFVPKYGDVVVAITENADDATDADIYAGIIDVSNEGMMPAHLSGFGPNKFDETERYVLADIHIARGSIPNRPGIGFLLQPDNTPLTSALSEEPRLVDGAKDGGIEGTTNSSYGISATDLNAFNGNKHNCILLIDAIRSDGFTTDDPYNFFEVYGSDDNSNWTQLTIKEIYRVDGHTYITFVDVAYSYFKVRAINTPRVPQRYSPAQTSIIHVEEMRLIDSRPDWLEVTNNTDDGRDIRGVSVKFKNLPELEPITVGDGRNSFGKYIGAEGLQQALYEAAITTSNSDIQSAYPRGPRKIIVGSGFYDLTRGLHVPCGSNVEFEPDTILRDRTGFGLLYSSKTLYAEGYREGSVTFYENTRQIKLSKNLKHYGIKEGCFVFFGNGDHLARIAKLSNCGHWITLDKRIPTTSGTSEVTVFGPSVRLTGLVMELLSGAPALSDYMVEFKYLEDVILKHVKITDETDVANGQALVKIDNVKNVYLQDYFSSTVKGLIGLYIRQCWSVSGSSVFSTAPNGTGVWIQQCINYIGIDGLNGLGDGDPDNDIKFTDSYGRSGRMGSKDSLNGTGIYDSGNTWLFDEFMKIRVLNEFICDGFSIINGWAYEIMLSMVIGWVQAFHSIPFTQVPSGWVDGLVTDFVIDWTA